MFTEKMPMPAKRYMRVKCVSSIFPVLSGIHKLNQHLSVCCSLLHCGIIGNLKPWWCYWSNPVFIWMHGVSLYTTLMMVINTLVEQHSWIVMVHLVWVKCVLVVYIFCCLCNIIISLCEMASAQFINFHSNLRFLHIINETTHDTIYSQHDTQNPYRT